MSVGRASPSLTEIGFPPAELKGAAVPGGGGIVRGQAHGLGKVGEGVSICFVCEDALALYHEFRGRGLEASRPFVGNRMWVTSLRDPDGYQLHFESSTDVREETVYAEPEEADHE